MKILIKGILMLIVALGFWACKEDEPESEFPVDVLPSDLTALQQIYRDLGVGTEYYPAPWSLEDESTWKKAGIKFDTIKDAETSQRYRVISSITLYMTREYDCLGMGLLDLNSLKELKVYGCADTYLHGVSIPATVESLLVERMNPEEPGYIIGVPNDELVFAKRKAAFKRLVMHGVDMKSIDCLLYTYAYVDLSHNTLEGDVPTFLGIMLDNPANLNYNKFTGLYTGWDNWIHFLKHGYISSIPMLQHNLIEDIPEEVLKSDFWKEYHENFIGNPGYKAPGQ